MRSFVHITIDEDATVDMKPVNGCYQLCFDSLDDLHTLKLTITRDQFDHLLREYHKHEGAMTTVAKFNEYYNQNRSRFSLGEAFCRYFNVDNPVLKAEKNDEKAQRRINVYFRQWGAN